MTKRYTTNRILLKTGESELPEKNLYKYRWTDANKVRHTIYAKTLDELRAEEDRINIDKLEGINAKGMNKTLNDMFAIWLDIKRGLKDNTLTNYKYMYNTYVLPSKLGHMKIANIKKTDIKTFYNNLKDAYGIKISTIENINNVIHQVLQIAVDDDYIRKNPTDNILREFKKAHPNDSERKRALTIKEEELFLEYLRKRPEYRHWYPIFCVMIKTGMRVGECTGLRWQDIDLEERTIDINHTLVYYSHEKGGCRFDVNSTKTVASTRVIPMPQEVYDAFVEEREYQKELGLESISNVDGYCDFIFINRFGECQHNGTLNKALVRIIRDCNDEVLAKNPDATVLLPHFSCHNLRHTYTTRMCEANINPKVIQHMLGHADITTTLNIYADCTEELQNEAIQKMKEYYKRVNG